jgi:tetratricopeptide (TPR) repeat protein
VVEVVKKVERGAWLPSCQVLASVPPALDAICRKAMALRPEERYGSALALAEDLEHWLGDEPVGAYPEPTGARLRRWMRKRPRRVTAAMVSLGAAVLGLTAGTVLLERSNREARESLAMVERQANYFVREVNEDLLMNEPGMLPLRQRILLKVLDDYAGFLKKRPGDPYARQQMAGAKRQLGEVYVQTGRLEEARALEDQAVAEYEGLLRESPKDRGLLFGQARARHVLAELQVQAGDPREGQKEVDRSIELLERLQAEEPGKVDYMLQLARGYDLRATLAGQQGDMASGLADNKRVLEILDEADSRVPGIRTEVFGPDRFVRMSHFTARTKDWGINWQRVLLLGRACTNQGILLSMSGQNGDAVRVLEEAIAVQQMLREQNSRAGQFRHGLALALLHFGRIKTELGLPSKAEPALREAFGLMRQLAQDDPHVKDYRTTRLLAAGYLGEALFRQGRTAAAAELLREAEKEGEEVLGGPRQSLGLRGQHARLLLVLGCLEGESGNLDRGLTVCLKAHEKLEQALHETPGDRSLRSDWLASREALARYHSLKGDLTRDRWITEQRVLLRECQDLAGQGPPSPQFQGEVAGSAAVLAGLLLEAGRSTEALACVDGVLPAHEKVVRAEQERVRAAAQEQKEAVPIPGKPNSDHDSLQLFLRTRPLLPDSSLHRQWATLLARRGAALARLGRGQEALEAVRQATGITSSLLFTCAPSFRADIVEWLGQLVEPCYLYDLACHQTLASTLPGANGRPGQAHLAVWLLGCSVAAGFDNPHKLRTDPALDPLRMREDFQKLVRDLEARDRGRKGAPRNH